MQDKKSSSRSILIGATVGTVVAFGVLGLSIYAIIQGVLQQRLIYVVEGAVPLFFGGWALWALAGFWFDLIRNRP